MKKVMVPLKEFNIKQPDFCYLPHQNRWGIHFFSPFRESHRMELHIFYLN